MYGSSLKKRQQVDLPGHDLHLRARAGNQLAPEQQGIVAMAQCTLRARHASGTNMASVGTTLSSNHFPGGFTPSPSWLGIGSMRFAFLVRPKPKHVLVQRERACSGTIGTFNQSYATVQKTLKFDGNHSRKRAFGCFACLRLFSHRSSRISCVRHVEGLHSFPFWFLPAPIPLLCGLRFVEAAAELEPRRIRQV